jgi:uncharacterized protein (TIGR00304 family)
LSVSAPLLGIGLAMTFVGAILVLLSFRPMDERGSVETKTAGVIFIGPIPIVFGGRGKLTLIVIALAIVVALLIAAVAAQPDIFGW